MQALSTTVNTDKTMPTVAALTGARLVVTVHLHHYSRLHYGLNPSADQLMKDTAARDRLLKGHDIQCC